jgi:purine-nucleoside/S-methyl-5'-thioadenosine phosphorylase / adenosine deaminase
MLASQPMSATLRVVTVPALEGIPGLVHGFERRLGAPGWETREEGRRRVAAALASRGQLHFLKQVHGSAIRRAPWAGTPEADAALAEDPGLLLGIETADCLPLLIVDPRRRVAAAAHAGWRGTAQGVASVAARALIDSGSDPAHLVAALGPAAGPCCYEVGEEVRDAFGAGAEGFFRPGPRGRPHLDVPAANRAQLLAAGLRAEAIHRVDECTLCQPDLYHSYRREGAGGGRMVSFVGFTA